MIPFFIFIKWIAIEYFIHMLHVTHMNKTIFLLYLVADFEWDFWNLDVDKRGVIGSSFLWTKHWLNEKI